MCAIVIAIKQIAFNPCFSIKPEAPVSRPSRDFQKLSKETGLNSKDIFRVENPIHKLSTFFSTTLASNHCGKEGLYEKTDMTSGQILLPENLEMEKFLHWPKTSTTPGACRFVRELHALPEIAGPQRQYIPMRAVGGMSCKQGTTGLAMQE